MVTDASAMLVARTTLVTPRGGRIEYQELIPGAEVAVQREAQEVAAADAAAPPPPFPAAVPSR